ncbi:hypothetical protein [Sphingosinicella sp. CPCC 101087]|uniref:hypothetical protein n=1 Tax=Sphingosinicella sp. CPCC 101087 TaxID=2497754 RepID=UPI00101B8D9A|nr:hypothetical protein [Sphingosinicella sp. CPCC 101087]
MLNLGRNVLVWIVRHLLALALIVLVLIAGRYALPPAKAWLETQYAAARALPEQQAAYADARAAFEAYARDRAAEAEKATAALADQPEARLRARRAAIGPAISARQAEKLSGRALALAAASGDSDRIFAHFRAGAEIALLERERRYIDGLLAAGSARQRRQDLATRRAEAEQRLHASYARWSAARERAEAFDRRALAGPRNFICRNAAPTFGCRNYRALQAARAQRGAALAENRRARAEIAAIDQARRAIRAADAVAEDAAAAFETQQAALAARAEAVERAARGNWVAWIRRPIVETLPTALVILAAAIFGPILIKAFLYFVVAPLAARRPPIRLVPDERGDVSARSSAPSVSQHIPIDGACELLVAPEAVQSTPHHAAKATQWLLSWSMPLSSLASGLVALVRIRSRDPDFVLASATGDPLAEIGLVAIADGSAMVLRPRALRGIVQPLGRPVRITRHWRLAYLSAWLTLQFRYLVFHGPCTLIVQGTRGVRLEPARAGRGINQAATIGFSAGLLYSVRRSEAFGAYLLGRQELFNDSFDGGPGFYLYEEMPREGHKGSIWGRGLRGLGDAALKVFGL